MSHVLVVDDSATQRLTTKFMLQSGGIVVETAKDGKEAFEAVQKKRPALVLSDMLMPQMDGLELLAALRAHDPTLPVFLMSASEEEHPEAARQADGFIVKGGDAEAILARVRAQLQRGPRQA